MEKSQNGQYHQNKRNKNSGVIPAFALVIMYLTVSSCSVIEGIFKAGMGVGIFAILAILVVIVFVISRFRKK